MRWSVVKSPEIVKVRTRFDQKTSKQFHEARLIVGPAVKFDVDARLLDGSFSYDVPPASTNRRWVAHMQIKSGIELNKTAKYAECQMATAPGVPCTVASHGWNITVAITEYYGSPGEFETDTVDFECANCP